MLRHHNSSAVQLRVKLIITQYYITMKFALNSNGTQVSNGFLKSLYKKHSKSKRNATIIEMIFTFLKLKYYFHSIGLESSLSEVNTTLKNKFYLFFHFIREIDFHLMFDFIFLTFCLKINIQWILSLTFEFMNYRWFDVTWSNFL